jgi:hypothetical protein
MKKQLNVDQIQSELHGGSAFFPGYKGVASSTPASENPEPAGSPPSLPAPQNPPHKEIKKSLPPRQKAVAPDDTVIPRYRDTTTPRNHETMIPADESEMFEVVRKAVKQIGKEAATYRFTLDEKNHLADIKYTYKRQGILTSENEVTRIAINYFIEDYRKNGEESLLAKILKRLNS